MMKIIKSGYTTIFAYPQTVLKFLRHHTYRELFDRLWRIIVKPLYESSARHIVKLDLRLADVPDPNLDIKEINAVNIDKMLEVMYISRGGLQERFSRGDRCFAVFENGKIISYFWAQFGRKDLCELHLKFDLRPNQAWMYNAITIKTARGRGLCPNVIRHMAKVLLQSGIDEGFVDVDPKNRSSVRSLEKAGCTPVVYIRMNKIFSSINYKFTIFNKRAWQQLSKTIEDFQHIQNILKDKACYEN